MPAVAALRALHPDWDIGWAIEPRWRALLATSVNEMHRGVEMPMVDGWFAVPTQKWKQWGVSMATASSVVKLRRELRVGRFDLCVDMQGTIRSSMVGRMAGVRRFVGMDAPRERAARMLYGERVKLSATHVVEQGCELLGTAVGEVLRPGKVVLPVNATAETWCDGLGLEGRFVLIAPTAGWGAKEWPPKRFGAVAAALGKAGFGVVVNAWGLDATADAVVRASKRFAMAIPCTVGQMIALVRRASLVIGGDTGPLHLAAALERPVLGLYGPTDPARNGPFGARTVFPGRVLRDASSVTDHSRIAGTESGLMRIEVDEVVGAALEILGVGG